MIVARIGTGGGVGPNETLAATRTGDPLAPRGPPARRPRLRFGDYEILSELGRGVWVSSTGPPGPLNRPVALKMLRSGLLAGDDPAARRFRNEAEAVVLDHPNIVPVHEVGEHHGQSYISMKLIEGEGLASAPRPLSGRPRGRGRLVADVAEAVAHARPRHPAPRPQAGQRAGRRRRAATSTTSAWPSSSTATRS
ncbi:MAG: hypothetical protein U0800_02490 [Isosphaeraceae bacterium]